MQFLIIDLISVPIDNKNTVTVNEVPLGTYIITEKDDMYFDFVSILCSLYLKN